MTRISFKDKKAIVFDLDGTVVNLAADWMSLKKKLFDMYKNVYNEVCLFESVSACLSNIIEKGDIEILENFFDIIRKYELENIQENKPIEETIFFINNKEEFGVKEDTKLAILSLNTRLTIIKSLKLANIMDKFDFCVGREDVRKWKPDPEGIHKIQVQFGLKKEEMIYFGDLKKDILTGENAGIDVFYIEELINLVKQRKRIQ
jgi:HAD superfamily hydrolase (TIGR01549 family)